MISKHELRQALRQLGRALSPSERSERSGSVCTQLKHFIAQRFAEPCVVALYAPLADEPDISPLALELEARGYTLCLPRVEGKEQMGMYRYSSGDVLDVNHSFALSEPLASAERIAPEQIDLIIVPGMAYDAEGFRLGRGAGYYDRYLPQTRAHLVGVSLNLLPQAKLPRDAWDYPLQTIIHP